MMKLKTIEIDGKTYAEVQDGKPLYVHDDGKEIAFDAPGASNTIGRLNREAQGHREAKETLEKQIQAFEGITDPDAARKALETVANLDDKKLIDAGEVEKVKAEISKAYQSQIDEVTTKKQELESQLYQEKIGGSFSRSKLIAERFAIPADLVQAYFGKSFKVEEGQIVAYDEHNQKVYSRENPGALASFDEALEILVDSYPHKDSILKASGAAGMGSNSTSNGNSPSAGKGDFGGDGSARKAAIASKFPDLARA